jgi:hypothetical protein
LQFPLTSQSLPLAATHAVAVASSTPWPEAPACTLAPHTPSVQLRQALQDEFEQQLPSTQLPLVHCTPFEQGAPVTEPCFGWQVLLLAQ